MYLNEKEISEITKGFEKRLCQASQKAPDSSGDMASIQSWMRRNNVETPETLNIAVKKIGNGAQKEMLYEGRAAELCDRLLFEARKYDKHQRPIRELYSYYHSRRKKMKYAEFQEKGYSIGSGIVESTHRYLVQQRLKQAGMKWNVRAATAIIKLRELIYDDTWQAVWKAKK